MLWLPFAPIILHMASSLPRREDGQSLNDRALSFTFRATPGLENATLTGSKWHNGEG